MIGASFLVLKSCSGVGNWMIVLSFGVEYGPIGERWMEKGTNGLNFEMII